MNCLTIISDSMDKGKWSYPRLRLSKMPAKLEKLTRPKCVITAVLAHGHCSAVFAQDAEVLTHGADCVLEQLLRVLQHCHNKGPLPQHIVLQTDNTCAWSKNSTSHLFAAWLVAGRKVDTFTMLYLQEGHTHEDVDRFFSMLLPWLHRSSFDSIADIVRMLKESLAKYAEDINEDLLVQEIQGIHPFEDWLQPLKTRLFNTFRSRVEREGVPEKDTCHSFLYKRRQDLLPTEKERLRGRHQDGHPDDVFCIAKGRMHHSHEEAHPPVCVLLADRLDRIGRLTDPCLVKLNSKLTNAWFFSKAYVQLKCCL